ncbi:hypothetical protein RM190_15130 [Paracoccus sp. CPCC 101403]|uniref:DUF2946 domain-containing protein n=1 Tax=Paracoccus broussonetiae TaxID=3075834 RepID=A0ABU3EG49_9RHOB|nr:hypothetical protein [Paracoccus sp. CPCC 101403]MDT1063207.1 hypothetical protein [Paracoccus sp. CPCC 101403]
MKRFAFIVLAILSLCLAPYMAAAHATGMATGQMTHEMAMDHASAHNAHRGTVVTCHGKGSCGTDAAVCAWVCAGGAAIDPVSLTFRTVPVPRAFHALPAARIGKGMVPPLNERPPNSSFL